jgi:hypothetical protein
MESLEWDPEYYDDGGEDYSEEWGDPEFLPGFPGLPRRLSPSSALARRFFPQRRRPTPARPPARRQRTTATQLALHQQRIAAQQSSHQFGPMATGAVGALALGYQSGDMFSPTIVNALPLAQLLLQTRGQAISAGFRANPWSTLGFPAAALALTVFRDKIPGLAPKIVAAPTLSITVHQTPAGPADLLVFVTKPQGTVVRFTTGRIAAPVPDPTDKDPVSPESLGTHRLAPGDFLKFRAFAGGVGSDVVTAGNP